MQPITQNDQQLNVPVIDKPKRKVRAPIIVLLLIFVCASVAVGTLWLLLFFLPVMPLIPLTPPRVSDFALKTTNYTSFAIPKQWVLLQSSAPGVTYGNAVNRGQQPSEWINVIYNKEPVLFTNFSTAPDSLKDSERTKYFGDADKWIESLSSCKDRKVVKKEKDTTSSGGITGLFYFELSCTSPDRDPYTFMTRVVAGDDGRVRLILMTVQDDDLKVNRGIYDKMLKSVAQIDP